MWGGVIGLVTSPHLPAQGYEGMISLFVLCSLLGISSIMVAIPADALFLPIIALFFCLPLSQLRETSLFIIFITSLLALPGIIRRRLFIVKKVAPLFVVAPLGAGVGSFLANRMPPPISFPLIGLCSLGLVLALIIRPSYQDEPWEVSLFSPFSCMVIFVMALITGMCGMGTGIGTALVLNHLMGVPAIISVGTAKLLLALEGGVASFMALRYLPPLSLLIPCILGILCGSLTGVVILSQKDPPIWPRWFLLGTLFLSSVKFFLL